MDRLTVGQRLEKNQSLTSQNGVYTLILQEDGNLVIYTNGRAIWSSGTAGRAVSYAIMQNDGNFVIYGYPSAVWDTDTVGTRNPVLIMQNDGNLVLYGWRYVWDSNTARIIYRHKRA